MIDGVIGRKGLVWGQWLNGSNSRELKSPASGQVQLTKYWTVVGRFCIASPGRRWKSPLSIRLIAFSFIEEGGILCVSSLKGGDRELVRRYSSR